MALAPLFLLLYIHPRVHLSVCPQVFSPFPFPPFVSICTVSASSLHYYFSFLGGGLTVFPLFNLSLSRPTTRFLLEEANASLSRPADVRTAEARCPRRRLSALLSSLPFLLFSLCRH